MIKIYGTENSRAVRPIWTAEEMGLEYELVMMPFPPRVFMKEYLDIFHEEKNKQKFIIPEKFYRYFNIQKFDLNNILPKYEEVYNKLINNYE